jgi:hypothetical protein
MMSRDPAIVGHGRRVIDYRRFHDTLPLKAAP